MIDILIGIFIGMGLCGIGGSIYGFILIKDSPKQKIKKFLKKKGLILKGKFQVEKWEDDKYLIERGAEAIPAEYLRQKYKIVSDDEVTLDYFVEIASKHIRYIGDCDEGFFVVKSDTDLLRPPEPPKEYPPIPDGWNEI